MSRFSECLRHVLAYEGGYANHPADRGRATMRGVTQATFDAYNAAQGHPLRHVQSITDAEVTAIYHADFWARCACDGLPPPLDLVVFDAAVQHGAARSVRWLQAEVGEAMDGQCGPKTLYAVRQYALRDGLQPLVDACIDRRRAFYAQIVANDPTQRVFARGWARRVNELVDVIEAAPRDAGFRKGELL